MCGYNLIRAGAFSGEVQPPGDPWSGVWTTLALGGGSDPPWTAAPPSAAPGTGQDISNSDKSWLKPFQTSF